MEGLSTLSPYDLTISSSIHDYHVSFVEDYRPSLSDELRDGDIVILDSRLTKLLEIDNILDGRACIEIDATEAQKSYLALEPIIEGLITAGFRRNNRLVAIGGGITQDITSFISSIIYRGVDWIFYPTTLLAQGDSCVGGKTSINFGAYKNQLGNFYPPNEIFIDVSLLETLSELDLRSGIGEICHFFLIAGDDDYTLFKKLYTSALQRDKESLVKLVSRCLQIKKGFVEIDEFDHNERLVLNYGHSFGHAIESLSNYDVPHGIAVCYGMDLANFVSVKLNLLCRESYHELHQLLSEIWGETKLGKVNQDTLESALKRDKKNIGSDLRLILTKGVGSMFIVNVPANQDFSHWIREYFSFIGVETS